jgi:hypothetical protein
MICVAHIHHAFAYDMCALLTVNLTAILTVHCMLKHTPVYHIYMVVFLIITTIWHQQSAAAVHHPCLFIILESSSSLKVHHPCVFIILACHPLQPQSLQSWGLAPCTNGLGLA